MVRTIWEGENSYPPSSRGMPILSTPLDFRALAKVSVGRRSCSLSSASARRIGASSSVRWLSVSNSGLMCSCPMFPPKDDDTSQSSPRFRFVVGSALSGAGSPRRGEEGDVVESDTEDHAAAGEAVEGGD